MKITLLAPHDKICLWEIKQQDKLYYCRTINDLHIGDWQEKELKDICAAYSCGSWYSLQKQKLNTDSFRGWKGFGYRKSAYSTWLVDSYLNKQPQALKLKLELTDSIELIKCRPHLEKLQVKVKTLGKSLFEDLNSFSHYGDFEIVNWREITLNWVKH